MATKDEQDALMEMMTPITKEDLIRMAGKITFPPTEAKVCGESEQKIEKEN